MYYAPWNTVITKTATGTEMQMKDLALLLKVYSALDKQTLTGITFWVLKSVLLRTQICSFCRFQKSYPCVLVSRQIYYEGIVHAQKNPNDCMYCVQHVCISVSVV